MPEQDYVRIERGVAERYLTAMGGPAWDTHAMDEARELRAALRRALSPEPEGCPYCGQQGVHLCVGHPNATAGTRDYKTEAELAETPSPFPAEPAWSDPAPPEDDEEPMEPDEAGYPVCGSCGKRLQNKDAGGDGYCLSCAPPEPEAVGCEHEWDQVYKQPHPIGKSLWRCPKCGAISRQPADTPRSNLVVERVYVAATPEPDDAAVVREALETACNVFGTRQDEIATAWDLDACHADMANALAALARLVDTSGLYERERQAREKAEAELGLLRTVMSGVRRALDA